MNKLGFGYLRLPKRGEQYDTDLLCALTDRFLELGGRYFDTAYTYLEGKSEWAIRECLVKRHPRDSFVLADKLPGYRVSTYADCRRYFDEQLERCGVTFFDVYLLHWLNRKNYAIAEAMEEFRFLSELKEQGLAKKIGFSYHDTADLLEEILTRHPEVDYVQLQINYLDWESDAIQSRRCYEVAVAHGKKVIVMEPVKGGTLANLPDGVRAILDRVDSAASAASLALRFVQSLPQVETVLSGMNAPEQVEDNLRSVDAMTQEEMNVMQEAAELLRASIAVPCTACGYCLSHCPKHIVIPGCFKLYNEYRRAPDDDWKITPAYRQLTLSSGKVSDCIACGACARSCPQKLPIPDLLRDVKAAFEG